MKYRIKITRTNAGIVRYYAQKKYWWWWDNLFYNGDIISYEYPMGTREEALVAIDNNYNQPGAIASIEFEYINKP